MLEVVVGWEVPVRTTVAAHLLTSHQLSPLPSLLQHRLFGVGERNRGHRLVNKFVLVSPRRHIRLLSLRFVQDGGSGHTHIDHLVVFIAFQQACIGHMTLVSNARTRHENFLALASRRLCALSQDLGLGLLVGGRRVELSLVNHLKIIHFDGTHLVRGMGLLDLESVQLVDVVQSRFVINL